MSNFLQQNSCGCLLPRKNSITVSVAAKVNLSLIVKGKRTDGYSDLCSILTSIALYDSVTIAPIVSHDNSAGLPQQAHNNKYSSAPQSQSANSGNTISLCATSAYNIIPPAAQKTADAFTSKFGLPYVSIKVKKGIPLGAGLGGSSAVAAAIIIGMCKLFDINLFNDVSNVKRSVSNDVAKSVSDNVAQSVPSQTIFSNDLFNKDILSLAASIGSDVPFQLYGGIAKLSGKGDFLEFVAPTENSNSFKPLNIVIAKPKGYVVTADCFAQYYKLVSQGVTPKATPKITTKAKPTHNQKLLEALQKGDLQKVSPLVRNDLTSAAISLNSEILTYKQTISQLTNPQIIEMSGSGSSVFALYESANQAQSAERLLKPELHFVKATTTIPHSKAVIIAH
ncbi:MAG: hypothetical protein FWB72_03450 [Firmicutes bacterium]|nr:hypothetical protein [Bacillota bacterium]